MNKKANKPFKKILPILLLCCGLYFSLLSDETAEKRVFGARAKSKEEIKKMGGDLTKEGRVNPISSLGRRKEIKKIVDDLIKEGRINPISSLMRREEIKKLLDDLIKEWV